MPAVYPSATRVERIVTCAAGTVLKTALWPLRILVAVRMALFLIALVAMLFWHPDVPFHELNRWTFCLLFLAVLCGALVAQKTFVVLDRASWPMLCLAIVVLVSLLSSPRDADSWGVFAAKYLVPFSMFHIAKVVFAEEKQFQQFEILLFVVLAYLTFTSVACLADARFLVFPKSILDPELGYHAERARGPFLQPVANGVSLNLLALLIWHACRRRSLSGAKVLIVLASVPVAVLATLTRAVWISFAGSAGAVLLRLKNRKRRVLSAFVVLAAVAGLGLLASATSLGRVLSDRVEESSPVDYRMAVYTGGWHMFLDRPFLGWGFHQMPAELPRYVSEFDDKVLYPHNTYLEVLVENGLLGFLLYVWMMWELLRLGKAPIPQHEAAGFLDVDFHQLWPILLIVYWINAAVVVMSYHFVNALLFSLAGMLAGQRQRAEGLSGC